MSQDDLAIVSEVSYIASDKKLLTLEEIGEISIDEQHEYIDIKILEFLLLGPMLYNTYKYSDNDRVKEAAIKKLNEWRLK